MGSRPLSQLLFLSQQKQLFHTYLIRQLSSRRPAHRFNSSPIYPISPKANILTRLHRSPSLVGTRTFRRNPHPIQFRRSSRSRLLWTTAESGEERGPGIVVRKSGLSFQFFALGIALGLGVSFVYTLRPRDGQEAAPLEKQVHFADILPEFADMTTEVLPGRPGNLTLEQEAKLRELWQLVLRVFGVVDPLVEQPNGNANGITPSPSIAGTESSSTTDSGRKKSRLSMFRRKRDDESTVSLSSTTTGTESSLSTTGTSGKATPTLSDIIANGLGENDKHGMSKNFRAALASISPEELRKAFWSTVKHDHPDALLLRFLRARKWDVNAALVMAISALHWRHDESHVDSDIMFRGEEGMLNLSKSSDKGEMKEGDDFMAQIRMGKSFLHGYDKHGRPLCYVRVRLHRQGEQSEGSLERYTVYTIETARMFLKPPVDTATIIFDLTDFSLANMDYIPVKFMIKCFEANYPESLGAVLVHKSPWLFQGIWKIIRGWLDPVVASKVHFTNDLPDLAAFIEESEVIKELGGPTDWEYKYEEPREGENKCMEDHSARDRLKAKRSELSREYENVVLEWIGDGVFEGPTGGALEGAGGKATEEYRKRRDELAHKIRDNYWELDPYVRARSIYDRMGILRTASRPQSSRGESPD